jgi:hypothetical protein
MADWKCDDCGWVKVGDDCVCPREASDADCHCIELTLMSAPCEDAPCCGCCDPGRAVMP